MKETQRLLETRVTLCWPRGTMGYILLLTDARSGLLVTPISRFSIGSTKLPVERVKKIATER